jgi:hypothetical protein
VKIPFFSKLMPCLWAGISRYFKELPDPKNKDTTILRNFRNYLRNEEISHTTGCDSQQDGCENLESHIHKLSEQRLITQNIFTGKEILQSL